MNIYVGNLSFNAREEDLNDLFSAYGEVSSARVVIDKMSGKPKGFGFVEMPSDDAARQAIDELNGKEHLNRMLTVNEARPRENNFGGGGRGPRRDGGGGGYRGGRY